MKYISPVALLLCTALAVSGCAGTPAPPSSSPPAEIKQTPVESESIPEPVRDDSLLDELILSGAGDGEPVCRLPLLNDDTADALAWNSRMKSLGQQLTHGEIFHADSADWKDYRNGSLVSLVIELMDSNSGTTEHVICTYDFETGSRLSGENLLARADLSESDFAAALTAAAARQSDRSTADLDDLYGNCSEAILDLRARTISDANLSSDQIQLFPAGDGQLAASVMIATPAGGGYYPSVLHPQYDTSGIYKKTECDFISAELENNQVTVTFRNTGLAGILMSGHEVIYDHPYPVEGLYGIYKDIDLGFIGNSGCACLILTDTDGRITFCNLMSSLDSSGSALLAAGPLPQPKHVQSCSFSEYPDGSLCEALLEDGSLVELGGIIAGAENTAHKLLENDWLTSSGSYVLTTGRDAAGLTVSWVGTDGTSADGRLWYSGMTDHGIRYGFHLYNGIEPVYGHLTLAFHSAVSSPEETADITITRTSGGSLPGIGESQNAVLHMR